MTEKRFTFTQDTLAKSDVFDGSEFICCTLSVWVEQLVDLLNQLNDENIEMHIQNDFLKDENQHMRDLVNENKQLKTRIQLLSTLLDAADAIIDLSNNGMAKAFWKKRNNEVEQEYKVKYKKGDDE